MEFTQKQFEQIIQYQTKSLDMMRELLFKQIEEDKKRDDYETEQMLKAKSANEELDWDYNQDKKLEESL